MNADKIEIQKQWDTEPCGATTSTEKIGSLAFYREVRAYRFGKYAPWLGKIVPFSDWQDMDILEIGPGLGSDHYLFAEQGNRMTTVDLSWAHLQHTRNHLSLEKLKTRPVFGDAEDLPFGAAAFDLVYAFGVLHHTPDTQKSIEEIHRVLRPGGKAIIGLYHRNSWFFWIQTIFQAGIVHGGLWRKGWRRLLSEIEFRSDSNTALPLVKVYSRKEANQLFSTFSRPETTTCHVEADHFSHFSRLMKFVDRNRLERWLGRGGWYLIIQAAK